MTRYWRNHRFEIIVWVIVGVLLIVFLAWCYCSKSRVRTQPATPFLRPRRYSDDHDVELAPLPRAFISAPLYEDYERDVWVPNDAVLEKRADGYYYPEHANESYYNFYLFPLSKQSSSGNRVKNNTLLYILILYGIFLAVPLLFFVLYIMFKISERKKDEVSKKGIKKKAREFAWESAHGSKSRIVPTTIT